MYDDIIHDPSFERSSKLQLVWNGTIESLLILFFIEGKECNIPNVINGASCLHFNERNSISSKWCKTYETDEIIPLNHRFHSSFICNTVNDQFYL